MTEDIRSTNPSFGQASTKAEKTRAMQAVYFDGRLSLKSDYPCPVAQPGEALIRVTSAGVCNTDLEIVQGYMNFTGIPGHEFVGIVEAADDPVWLGKRVCGDINAGCRTCDDCRDSNSHHCKNRTVLGIFNRDGAFAEYLTLPQANLYEVPDNVSDQAAVFTEPLAAAFEIPEQVKIAKTDRVIVMGDGKLGLLIAQVLALYSDNVLLLGRHKEKMVLAEYAGVTTLLSEDYNEPMSADLVVEATGSNHGLEKALRLVCPRGTVVLKSTVANGYQIDLSPVVIHEINLVGSRCGPFQPALDALAENKINVTAMVSEVYSLGEGVTAITRATQPGVLKVLLEL